VSIMSCTFYHSATPSYIINIDQSWHDFHADAGI